MKIYFRYIFLSLVWIAALSSHADERDNLLPFDKTIVDFHVHVAGLGYGNSGCFVNKEMREDFRFRFYLMAIGTTLEELEQHGDSVIFEKISRSVAASKSVSHAIILSMDGVINEFGELDREKTQIYIPDNYVHEQTKKYDNLLFGSSINPYRSDAISRLVQAKKDGAILVKWIPSIMYIDPSDEKIIPFYKKMVELDIPLLTHTGMEKSFSSARDELADPLRLRLPLSLGVKVIAAHIATTGESDGQDNFERILPLFLQYPNLYADISSLTQINKLSFMEKAIAAPELRGRLIYGTDWPLQFFPLVSPWYHLDLISIREAMAISRIDNQWDRDVALKVAMGLDESVFYLGRNLFISNEENNHAGH